MLTCNWERHIPSRPFVHVVNVRNHILYITLYHKSASEKESFEKLSWTIFQCEYAGNGLTLIINHQHMYHAVRGSRTCFLHLCVTLGGVPCLCRIVWRCVIMEISYIVWPHFYTKRNIFKHADNNELVSLLIYDVSYLTIKAYLSLQSSDVSQHVSRGIVMYVFHMVPSCDTYVAWCHNVITTG
jgi:hypothetical protein